MKNQELYYGGTILTTDRTCPNTEAVLTENGKILVVGNLQLLQDTAAEPVDLQGNTMIPGFVDEHSHRIGTGIRLTKYCSLDGCTGPDDLLDRIRSFVADHDLHHGESIVCRGHDLSIMKEGKHPTAALLDTLGLDNPITCIHLSGHVAAYNTMAMRKAGICEETYVCPDGGTAGRDENGKLNGYFAEETKGIIKPGATADFVILDRDPTSADPMTIKDIHVVATIKEDKVLYRRNKERSNPT